MKNLSFKGKSIPFSHTIVGAMIPAKKSSSNRREDTADPDRTITPNRVRLFSRQNPVPDHDPEK